MEFVFIYSISLIHKFLLELIKRTSKVQAKNMSCEHTLNFDQWKTFFENYKPIRVWLWLVYKFTENLQLSTEFIQTQKRYPSCLNKISILTWKLFTISSQNVSCELNYQRTYSLQNISYLSLQLWVIPMKWLIEVLTILFFNISWGAKLVNVIKHLTFTFILYAKVNQDTSWGDQHFLCLFSVGFSSSWFNCIPFEIMNI